MSDVAEARGIAMALPHATEQDHHGMASFRIAGTVVGGIGIGLMSLVSQPWHALALYGAVFAIGDTALAMSQLPCRFTANTFCRYS